MYLTLKMLRQLAVCEVRLVISMSIAQDCNATLRQQTSGGSTSRFWLHINWKHLVFTPVMERELALHAKQLAIQFHGLSKEKVIGLQICGYKQYKCTAFMDSKLKIRAKLSNQMKEQVLNRHANSIQISVNSPHLEMKKSAFHSPWFIHSNSQQF